MRPAGTLCCGKGERVESEQPSTDDSLHIKKEKDGEIRVWQHVPGTSPEAWGTGRGRVPEAS